MLQYRVAPYLPYGVTPAYAPTPRGSAKAG